MVDYFADAPGQNGGAVQASNGDAMDADIQVRSKNTETEDCCV
jgi:hypothetical protein